MNCPACKDVLVSLELDQVEVDWCGACGGVWLDRGELELLHDHARTAADYLKGFKPAPGSAHAAKKCPICAARLVPVESSSNPGIVLDECPKSDGLWFDRGELARVIGPHAVSDRIKDFLEKVFSNK